MLRTRKSLFYSLIVSAVTIAALLLPTPSAHAGKRELARIKKAIQAREAGWVADETSVSKLTREGKKKRLGLDESEGLSGEGLDSSEFAPVPELMTAPLAIDWRNINGGSYVTPVKNQGSCGSCWAFAVTAALESQFMIATGYTIDLSEQTLVSCSGAGSCSGGSSATASNYIRDVGVPLESCFRYSATNNSCSSACPDWQYNTYSVLGWHRASATTITVDDVKSALYVYGPVVATMYVYNDFYYYKYGVYTYTSGSYVGAHAILVVGYDDANQCFIVKNSWGTGWGEAGYFRIAYSEMAGTSRFGYSGLVYDGYGDTPPPDATPPVASISSPLNSSTVNGGINVNVGASDNVGVTRVDLFINGSLYASDNATPYSFYWDTTRSPDGSYSLWARAYDASGNTGQSSPITVIVSNPKDTTPPSVSITSPVSGSTVGRKATIQVKALDNAGVNKVELYIDGILKMVSNSSSLAYSWNTVKVAKGAHTITGKGYDSAGNAGTSAITVYK